MDKTLKIGTHSFQSRLMVGTGKYKDFEETKSAITASGAEVVTVALRRTNMGQNKDELIFVLTHISSAQCNRNYFRTRCSDSTFSFFKIFIFASSNHQTRLKRMRAYF